MTGEQPNRTQEPAPQPPISSPGMAWIVERNIEELLKRRQAEEQRKTWQDKLADAVTTFTGSLAFVFIHLALFGVWIGWNVGWLGLKPFDPSFVVLAMFASVEAIFLSTFVLISQNRMAAQADKRAELNLQVSLLSEHEITRLIVLVAEMAKKLGIEEAHDPEIPDLAKDVQPEKVLDTIENYKQRLPQDGRPG
ncbi:DUF1003 domain-containing protein [Hymenobacter terrenus]|uniref:DUF1003 domain-containing protein n=1 Tax=Hymenobacter terrenus TaxID=1629124 RepID=UPI0006193938|nr:DUF1003 domain-containing protein [Hymenobacter terrenus]